MDKDTLFISYIVSLAVCLIALPIFFFLLNQPKLSTTDNILNYCEVETGFRGASFADGGQFLGCLNE